MSETGKFTPENEWGNMEPPPLMVKILRFIAKENAAGCCPTQDAIEKAVEGNSRAKRDALRALTERGYVETMPGPKNSRLHKLVVVNPAIVQVGEYIEEISRALADRLPNLARIDEAVKSLTESYKNLVKEHQSVHTHPRTDSQEPLSLEALRDIFTAEAEAESQYETEFFRIRADHLRDDPVITHANRAAGAATQHLKNRARSTRAEASAIRTYTALRNPAYRPDDNDVKSYRKQQQ